MTVAAPAVVALNHEFGSSLAIADGELGGGEDELRARATPSPHDRASLTLGYSVGGDVTVVSQRRRKRASG